MENTNVKQELIKFYNRQLKAFENARENRAVRPNGHRILNATRRYMANLYNTIEKTAPGTLLSPGRAIVEDLMEQFPVGCRIVLDHMEDPQAPPFGTTGTVLGVDDIGSIMVSWDAGGSLHVAYGKDECHRLFSVKRIDDQPIPTDVRYLPGYRVMLDKGASDAVPSGTVGTVRYVYCNNDVAVRWDGYENSTLTPGKDRFHRIFDTVTDPVVLAKEIHKFCEDAHYRQSPTIVGCWQPGALLEMTIEQLYPYAELNRIIRGIYRFRNSGSLSQNERCRADKILSDLYIRYAFRHPMIAMAKNEIDRFVLEAYRDPKGADYTDLCCIPVANTTLEDGREVQSVVDLVMYQIRTYVDGTLVETVQYDVLTDLILQDLCHLDFDALVSLPDGEEAT